MLFSARSDRSKLENNYPGGGGENGNIREREIQRKYDCSNNFDSLVSSRACLGFMEQCLGSSWRHRV
jgi:hypothetical protein